MKRHILACIALVFPAIAFLTAAASAQDAPDMTVLAKSAQIQAFIAKAPGMLKPGQTSYDEKLIGIAPFNASLQYWNGAVGANTHDKEDEIFYVVEGAGTFVTGGHLVPAGHPNPNKPDTVYTNIEGGHAHSVAKGDVFMVPHGTPHTVTAVKGSLVMITMHLPHPGL